MNKGALQDYLDGLKCTGAALDVLDKGDWCARVSVLLYALGRCDNHTDADVMAERMWSSCHSDRYHVFINMSGLYFVVADSGPAAMLDAFANAPDWIEVCDWATDAIAAAEYAIDTHNCTARATAAQLPGGAA